jgi:Tfp pilus assembly protein PilF
LNNALPLKINDYSGYVSRAVKNYKAGFYSDAAINCRKAAEAACKIIVHNAYNDKLAETKLNNKSLKELIILLIHEGLTERKAINTLETLQIIGNKAAHDNVIGKDETSYAIHALNLFTEYLFKEHLKISIPQTLDFIFKEEKATHTTEVVEKIIVQEKFNKETEEQLFSKIKDIEQKSEGDAGKFEELKQELIRSQRKIEELSQQKQNKEDEPVKPAEKKPSLTKNMLITLLALLALSGISLLIKYFLTKENAEKNTESTFHLIKSPDSVYVAINAIQVMQDNPGVDFKIETALYNRIHNLSMAINIPVSLIHTHFKGTNTIHDTLLINQAEKAGFDLVYYGSLYETAHSDSNILEIYGSLTIHENRISRDKKIKFKTLNDSTFIKELIDQGNMPVELYVGKHQTEKPRPLLKIMQGLQYYSQEQFNSVYNIIAALKIDLKDYEGALLDINEVLKRSPKDAFYLSFKAGLFQYLNKPDSGKVYFEKSLKQDSLNGTILLYYAGFCIAQKDLKKAEELLNKFRKISPADNRAYVLLAQLNMNKRDYPLAKSYALKANKVLTGEISNSILLGNLYGFIEFKKDSAEFFYNLALGKDSSNVDALTSLANFYQRFFFKDPAYKQKISVLLNKSRSLKVQDDIRTDYSSGMAAYDNRNYAEALSYFNKVYAKGSFDNEMLTCMAQCYYFLKQPDKALQMGKKALEFDSLSPNNLMVYSVLFGTLKPQEFKTTCYYYNKALALNPSIPNIYQEYSSYFLQHGKLKESIDIALKGYKLFSADYILNHVLAYSYLNMKNFEKSKYYFDNLITMKPDNDTLLTDFAQCIYMGIVSNQLNIPYTQGMNMVKRAIEINPKNATAYAVMATYIFIGNNKELAKSYYIEAKKLDKTIFIKELEKL